MMIVFRMLISVANLNSINREKNWVRVNYSMVNKIFFKIHSKSKVAFPWPDGETTRPMNLGNLSYFKCKMGGAQRNPPNNMILLGAPRVRLDLTYLKSDVIKTSVRKK